MRNYDFLECIAILGQRRSGTDAPWGVLLAAYSEILGWDG